MLLPATVAPAAEAAFERGVAAVQQQEWELAARHFSRAQEAAPNAPDILLNLGLAQAKAAGKSPGRLLAAIGWLQAYQAVAPAAENSAAARETITQLEAAAEALVNKLFHQATNAAHKLPDPASVTIPAQSRPAHILFCISAYQARAGQLDPARARKSSVLRRYLALSRLDTGDYESAREHLEEMEEPDRNGVLAAIALSHADRGDFRRARGAADAITDSLRRSALRLAIDQASQELDQLDRSLRPAVWFPQARDIPHWPAVGQPMMVLGTPTCVRADGARNGQSINAWVAAAERLSQLECVNDLPGQLQAAREEGSAFSIVLEMAGVARDLGVELGRLRGQRQLLAGSR